MSEVAVGQLLKQLFWRHGLFVGGHLHVELARVAERPTVAVSAPEGGLRGAAVRADSGTWHLAPRACRL